MDSVTKSLVGWDISLNAVCAQGRVGVSNSGSACPDHVEQDGNRVR